MYGGFRTLNLTPLYMQQLIAKGRSSFGGDPAAKVANNTYVVDRGEYYAVRYHSTDIIRFYPEYIQLHTANWDTHSTNERVNSLSPFWLHSLDSRYKHRNYFNYGDCARVHLRNTPWFGLDNRNGLRCSYSGHWIMQSKEEAMVDLYLPVKGGRSKARKAANALRRLLHPQLVMLQDQVQYRHRTPALHREHDTVYGAQGVERLAHSFVDEGSLSNEEVDFLVDTVLYESNLNRVSVGSALRSTINVAMMCRKYYEARRVHYDEVDSILRPRGPEWSS